MSKDYGERWRMGGLSAINRHGCPIDISEHARAVACVNALAGIPTESLPEVKKAWLAWKLVEWTIKIDIYEPIQNMQEVIDIALDFRKHGHDFGELNALLDSVKD